VLGDPGAFVLDGNLAMATLERYGLYPAVRRLGDGERLPGFADPDVAASRVLALARSLLEEEPTQVHCLVTHDLILSALVGRLRGVGLTETEWPGYLHGVIVSEDSGSLTAKYGSAEYSIPERLLHRI
jgi:broad specificity phosphatase PhoE